MVVKQGAVERAIVRGQESGYLKEKAVGTRMRRKSAKMFEDSYRREKMANCLREEWWNGMITCFTIYALFGDDFRLFATSAHFDSYFFARHM